MGLLDNAYVRQSRQMLREYKPVINTFKTPADAITQSMAHAVDVPCVEVQIPQRDWTYIEELIRAHERAIKHPAVQDAWDQYMMVRHLTDHNLPKR